jgi:formyltetrahydrofolate hydrolase
VREILNKVKEKKLKAIKSEISKITKIVDNVSNNFDKHQLEEISEELKNIKITLAKQDTILRDILLKLDENN